MASTKKEVSSKEENQKKRKTSTKTEAPAKRQALVVRDLSMSRSRMTPVKTGTLDHTQTQELFLSSEEERQYLTPQRSTRHMDRVCWIIIFQKLLERIAFYSTVETLVAYAMEYVGYANIDIVYKGLWITIYVAPILAGFFADNNFDRYLTSIFCGGVYLVGYVILILTTMNDRRGGLLLAAILWTVGCGSMKTPFTAMGGDQVPMEGIVPMHTFFSWFWLASPLAHLISLMTSFTRNAIKCKEATCYLWIFGGGAVLFVIAFCTLAITANKYHHILPEKGVCVKMIRMIFYSFSKWKKRPKDGEKKESFLYYAEDRYPTQFINDVKTVWFTFHFCLFCSIFSGIRVHIMSLWKKQSKQMIRIVNMREHFSKNHLQETLLEYSLDDEEAFLISFTTCIFIPIFNFGMYPRFAKCNLFTCYKSRMTFGTFTLALLCINGGVLEMWLQKGRIIPQLPSGNSSVHFLNVGACPINITSEFPNEEVNLSVNPGELSHEPALFIAPSNVSLLLHSECRGHVLRETVNFVLDDTAMNCTIGLVASPPPEKKPGFLMTLPTQNRNIQLNSSFKIILSPETTATIDYLDVTSKEDKTHVLYRKNSTEKESFDILQSDYIHLETGTYELNLYKNDSKISTQSFYAEGQTIEILALRSNASHPELIRFVELSYQKLSRWHHIPMYILLSLSDVTFTISLYTLVYSEGPDSVKAFVLSFIDIATLLGNKFRIVFELILAVISWNHEATTVTDFSVCAGLAFFMVIVLLILTIRSRKEDSNQERSEPLENFESDAEAENVDVNAKKLEGKKK